MRLAPALAAAALAATLALGLASSAMAQSEAPAIVPAPPGTPPIGPDLHNTPADLDSINAQIRSDEQRLTRYRDAAFARGNGVIADTRPALRFNPYQHSKPVNFARWFGWRKPKQ
jgi:hypothetical protein